MYRVAKRPSELTLCDLNECGYVSLSKIRCASEVRDDDAQTVSRRFAMQAKRDGQLRPCIPLFSLDSTIHFAARCSEAQFHHRSSPIHRARPLERSGVSARPQLWDDEPPHHLSITVFAATLLCPSDAAVAFARQCGANQQNFGTFFLQRTGVGTYSSLLQQL